MNMMQRMIMIFLMPYIFLYVVLEHASKIGKNKKNEALPFLTTLAALIYALSSTLGSGSYKDVADFPWSIIDILMYAVMIVIIIAFSACLMSYIFNVLDLPDLSGLEETKPIFRIIPTKAILPLSALALTPAAAMIAIMHLHGDRLLPPLDGQESNIIRLSVYCSLLIISTSAAERILISDHYSSNLALIVVMVCMTQICFTIYRDSYKSSLNTNSQFCYWVSRAIFNVDNSEQISFREADRRVCEDLLNNKVEFRFIFDSPFEGAN